MAGNFKFFSYLDVNFVYNWIDWAMSASVVAAGSNFLEKKFDIINGIPSVITGIRVGVNNNANSGKTNNADTIPSNSSSSDNNIKKFNYDEDPDDPTI